MRTNYGNHPAQFGELHLPPGEQTVPVVVVIHGGFWRQRNGFELGTPLAADLAEHGVAAWNIEYRRVGDDGGWPSTLEDVAAAIDALVGVNERVGGRLDLRNVHAVGHSAGGHLAVWAAGRHRLRPGTPGATAAVKIRAVVSQAGVLDLVGGAHQNLGDGAVEAFMGARPYDAPDSYSVADPIQLLPIGVPVVCVHGDADATVPIAQSQSYVNAAAAAGDRACLMRLPGVDHFALIDPSSSAWARCRSAVLGSCSVVT